MAIALVQAATQVEVQNSSTTAPSITLSGVVAGNALVLLGNIFDTNTTWTVSSVTDGGDAFTARDAAATVIGTEEVKAVLAHAVNVSAGAKTVAVNLAGTAAGADRWYVLGLLELAGVASAAAEDDFATNAEINVTSADISAGGSGFTTTAANALLVGVAASGSDTDTTLNFASPASWTNRYRQNNAVTSLGTDAGTWLSGAIQTNYLAQWTHDNTAGEFGAAVVVALLAAAPQVVYRSNKQRPHPALRDPPLLTRELFDVRCW